MSEYNNHIKQYSAEDILRYLKGIMPAEEMHRLEKQALEDPFLADAIEGMADAQKENKEELVSATLEELRKEFAERIGTGGKVVPMKRFGWWKVAAAAVIVIVAGVFGYNMLLQPSGPDKFAKSESKVPDPFNPEGASSEKKSEKQAVLQAGDSQVIAKRDETKTQRTATPAATSDTQNQPGRADIASSQQDLATSKTDDKNKTSIEQDSEQKNAEKQNQQVALSGKASGVQKENVQKSEPEIASAPSAGKRLYSKARAVDFEVMRKNFVGRVVDNNNTPVPNATVQVLNNRNAFLTDENGNFRIPTNDSILEVQVGIAGYNTRNFQLRDNAAMNNVILEQKNDALNEVVVANRERSSRDKNEYKTKYPAVIVQNAVPEIGWIEYEKYLENNKQVKKSDSLVTGDVVISFQVNRNGTLSNFKVEKSLQKIYNDEAIRLIKQGPSWKLIKGNKARVTMIVKF